MHPSVFDHTHFKNPAAPAAGGAATLRQQFAKGSFEVAQYINNAFHPAAWVYSPDNQFGNETWIWVTAAGNGGDAGSVYAVPGAGPTPNPLNWRITKILSPNATEAEFIAYVKSNYAANYTLIGTHHDVATFNP